MKFKPTHNRKIAVELDEAEGNIAFPANRLNASNQPFTRLKNILVPIDFSQCSKKALAYALPYAKEFGASLTLLFVAQGQFTEPGANAAGIGEKEIVEIAREKLIALAAAEIPQEIGTQTMVRTGRPFVEIINAACELPADLIIVSTRGLGRLPDFYVGSTTEALVRYAACPVLVVRQNEREFI
jgi:nucleotide-binding universal stress UspA family protein